MKTVLRSRAWRTVGLLWLVALLNYLDRLMITSMRDPLKADIAMTDAQFGLLTSVFLWTYGVCSPIGGYLADRFSRRTVIVSSLFGWSAATWLTSYMHSVENLLIVRIALGVTQACYIPAALALIADLHPGPTRSLATGVHTSGIYAGAALSGMGGVMAERFGWRAGFEWMGLLGLGYAVLVTFLLRDGVPPPEKPREAPPGETIAAGKIRMSDACRALFRTPAFLMLFAISALVGVANWGIYGWLPTYFREHFKLGLGAAGITATGYIQVASFVGGLAGGIWADRWSRTQPNARALVPAIGYCVVGPCLFFSITSELLPLAVGGLMIYGIGRGFFDANLMPTLRTIVDQRYSATGYGWLNFVGVMTGGVLIYVGGWLRDEKVDLARVFEASAVALFIVGLLLFSLKPRSGALP